ncbi:FG-GAP repeat protein [Microbulbifer variabilis]|uniref:FG-GAP repeat protein n=1 Tax=Microbulbifer variabilis TaxID=266805 RepID=UPI001CFEB5DC|nr:FG-GAP repeat protein [Microbulbifer variabilis]
MTIQYYKVLLILLLLSILSGCSGGSSDQKTVDEEPAVAESPAEDPPAEDPPAEDPPAEDPPAEDPPAEDPPAEDPPAEDPPAEDPPAAPGVAQDFTLSFEAVKIFRFNWTDAEGATHYHLLENPDGSSGFNPVVENIPQGSGTLALEVPLHARTNAQYILQACNGENEQEQCTDSDLLSVSDTLVASIGYFKASNTDPGDNFGFAISLSADGHTLAVGAHYERSSATGIDGDQSDNGAAYAGAVYVFAKVGETWVQQAYLKASNTDEYDFFGSSVSLSADGHTLAVSALGEGSSATGIDGDQSDNSAERAGAVYVFVRVDETWVQQAYLKASNTDAHDSFGRSVSLSADGYTLAVGADNEESSATGIGGDQLDNSASNAGAVYVFTRENDAWVQQAYIKASNTDAYDNFGYSVSLSANGRTLAVSALGEGSSATGIDGDQSDNSASNAGAVYVFTREDNTWVQQAYLKASNTDADDYFGSSVSLSADGHTLAVGADNEESSATGIDGDQSDNSASGAGAAYLFAQVGKTWVQQAYLKASNTDGDDLFGGSVSLSADGRTLAVAAIFEASSAAGINGDQSDNSVVAFASSAGAVYVFSRGEEVWAQQAYVKASNNSLLFGTSVALSADGHTLAVGAHYERSSATGIDGDQSDNSAERSGAVYVY